MNARHQRLRDLFQALPAQPARDEFGEAFVFPVAPGRDEELHAHPQLARPGDEAGPGERHDHGGHHEHDPLRKGMEAPPGEDEGPLVLVVRAEHLAGKPHFLYQLDRPVFLRKIAVGSAFNGEPADLFRAELAPDGGLLLEEDKIRSLFLQIDGAGKGGDPPADDGRSFHSGAAVVHFISTPGHDLLQGPDEGGAGIEGPDAPEGEPFFQRHTAGG